MLRQLATLMQIRFTYQMLVGSAPKPKNRRFHNCFPGSVPSSLAADCSCEEHLEIIDHLESGCGRLAPIENLQRYDRTTHTLVNMSRVQCHSQKELVATESPYIVQKKKEGIIFCNFKASKIQGDRPDIIVKNNLNTHLLIDVAEPAHLSKRLRT